ncbi:MAG: radical SAM protein [Proteobacteria bacterium]|nr:radical SAM protein [Pseudomonadota bacterium]
MKRRLGPDGLHLFDRNTGLNILFDEVVSCEHLWSKAPRQISIALTNVCDLSCSHCYAPKHKASLDFSSVTKWLSVLDQHGCIGVGFGGGEPTLYSHLVELLEFAATKTGLAVTMTTHAHRLVPEHLEYLHFLRVSMDGVGATYEKIRGRPFGSLLDKLALVKKNMPFGINYVVNSTTIRHLDDAIQISEDYGASEFLLLPEAAVGRGKGIDAETLQSMKKWIQNYRGRVRLAVSENHTEGLPVCQPFKYEEGLRAYAHIDAQSVLKKTSFDRDGIFINGEGIMGAVEALGKQEKMGEIA